MCPPPDPGTVDGRHLSEDDIQTQPAVGGSDHPAPSTQEVDPEISALDLEETLLGPSPDRADSGYSVGHATKNVPVFTGDALQALGPTVFRQRALYGSVIEQHGRNFPVTTRSRKLYFNPNAPFSAVVCGLQGTGKSHSTSVLLESCLIKDPRIGSLPAPLAGLVFHLDKSAGGSVMQPCEAAFLACLDSERGGSARPPRVTVLAMPNSVPHLTKVYSRIPGVTVRPLRFAPEDISAERLLSMMKVEENGKLPLYMELIMDILRRMEGNFDYHAFRQAVTDQKFNPTQKAMLDLRLSLLDSCLEGGNRVNSVTNYFVSGCLTIVDLSSPFMESSSACGIFDIVLGHFLEAELDIRGKIVVLDEAHKYLSEDGGSSRLTESLLSVIRQQRHIATRVIISTQEPTVVPSKFLDLCSVIIVHRFDSPEWHRHLSKHISATGIKDDDLFSKITDLQTGEALMFASTGLGVRNGSASAAVDPDVQGRISLPQLRDVGTLSRGFLLVRSRLRITLDGGQSVLAISDSDSVTGEEPPLRTRTSVMFPGLEKPIHSHGHENPPQSAIHDPWDIFGTAASHPISNGHLKNRTPLSGTSEGSAWSLPRPDLASVAEIAQPGPNLGPTAAADGTVVSGSLPFAPTVQMGGARQAEALPQEHIRYLPLVDFLHEQLRQGVRHVPWSAVCAELPSRVPELTSHKLLKSYVNGAVGAKLVSRGRRADGEERWIELCSGDSVQSTSPSALVVPAEYATLVKFLRQEQQQGVPRVTWTAVGVALRELLVPAMGPGVKLKSYLSSARDAGVIELHVEISGQREWVELSRAYSNAPTPVATTDPDARRLQVPARFAPFVNYLRRQRQLGIARISWASLGAPLREAVPELASKQTSFKKYILDAMAAGLIDIEEQLPNRAGWVELKEIYVAV